MMTDWGLINSRSVVRVELDNHRREMIPRRGTIGPIVTYMDAIQLRVCDLEFLARLQWVTPHKENDSHLELHSQTDIWEPKWYKRETIPDILRKVYDCAR